MKKMYNKGFTLVELLAMLTVLAVLMIVAIPNISQILKNSRMNQVKMDARKMVDSAKIKISKDNKKTIKDDENMFYYIFSLDYLDTNDDIKKGPNGGEYDKYSSFVIYNRSDGTPHYYVRLIEKKNNDYYVLTKDSKNITEIDEITKKDSTIEVKKVNSISTATKDDYKAGNDDRGTIEEIIKVETGGNISADKDHKFYYITGDTNCPANSYSGIANVDDDGTPCTEGVTCHPRSTCICYDDNEVYNGSQCVPKS